jgi:hypothetical protein
MAYGDPTVYKKHLGGHNWVSHTDKGSLELIKQKFKIGTMLDIGCGPGGNIRVAKEVGIDAEGIDGDIRVIPENPDINIIPCDFAETTYTDKDYDLAWSTEFVEHVEEKYIDNYMQSFAKCKYAFITYAPPGTNGTHHVNLKEQDYWIKVFGKYGFEYDEASTNQIRQASTMKRDFVRSRGLFFRRTGQIKQSKVLLVASGFSSKQINDYPYKQEGWTVVAINNGYRVCDWDYWVRPPDFEGEQAVAKEHQTIVKAYGPALNKYGGQKACGFSITLNAGYWALSELAPSVMAFLGCDMNYTPTNDGATSIYGVGNDIKQNGIPDPDRMAKMYGKGDPNYLTNIYRRLEDIAQEHNCEVVNLSTDPDTRLPYKRVKPSRY